MSQNRIISQNLSVRYFHVKAKDLVIGVEKKRAHDLLVSPHGGCVVSLVTVEPVVYPYAHG